MHLSVNVQFRHASAGSMIGKTDCDWFGALRERHCNFKQLQRDKKEKKYYIHATKDFYGKCWSPQECMKLACYDLVLCNIGRASLMLLK